MKNIYILLFTILFLSGCESSTLMETSSEPRVPRERLILENLGYTDIELGGMPMFECSDDDNIFASSKFTAKNEGRVIEGAVCCGMFLKGCTVRY